MSLWLVLAACGASPSAPAPPVDPASSPLREVLAGTEHSQPPPPPGPGGSGREAPRDQPPTAGCLRARARLATARRQADDHRSRVVAPAEDAWLRAVADARACREDRTGCAHDGRRLVALLDRVAAAKRSYERSTQRAAELETGIYDAGQAVSRACGEPAR